LVFLVIASPRGESRRLEKGGKRPRKAGDRPWPAIAEGGARAGEEAVAPRAGEARPAPDPPGNEYDVSNSPNARASQFQEITTCVGNALPERLLELRATKTGYITTSATPMLIVG
jgi:hypothetical protein